MEITFSVDGLVEVQQKFWTWGKAIEDLSPAWMDIGDDIRADNAANFASEGGWYSFGATVARTGSGRGARGSSWAPLAPSTVRERERLGYGGAHPILVRQGDLMESLTVLGARGNITRIGPTSAEFGTAHPLAPFHHWGTRRMPARPLVGLTWRRKQGIVKRLGDYIREQALAAGLNAE